MSRRDVLALVDSALDARDREIARLEAENDALRRKVGRLEHGLATAGEAFAQRDKLSGILSKMNKRGRLQ